VTTLVHPPYSPDVAPADVYLFSPLKSVLKGRRFCDATDIIKNEKEELKRLSQNGFQDVSNTLTVAGRRVFLQKRTILKKICLK